MDKRSSLERDLPGIAHLTVATFYAISICPTVDPFRDPLLLLLAAAAVTWIVCRQLVTKECANATSYSTFMLFWLLKCQALLEGHAEVGAEASGFGLGFALGFQYGLRFHLVVLAVVHLSGLMLGHELMHQVKQSKIWPCLVFLHNGYMVYIWEHKFHHKHVATDLDYSSTKRFTNIYWYLLTRYPIHVRSGFRFSKIPFILTTIVSVAYYIAIWQLVSADVAKVFVAMTFVHFALVDAFTYTSHYGVVDLGVKGEIAWDSEMRWFLRPFAYGIEHHAAHHHMPIRLAINLQDHGHLKYPCNLEVALLTAFVPPLWYKMTHPILDRARA